MIKANELRIGNLVDYEKTTHIVTAVQEEMIYSRWYKQSEEEGDYYDYPKNYDPIPLTPEILEKCGFEKEESNDTEERNIWSIQVGNSHSLYYDPELKGYTEKWYISHYWNNNSFQNGFWNHPEYLHQLQNLYFALTGEELPVSL